MIAKARFESIGGPRATLSSGQIAKIPAGEESQIRLTRDAEGIHLGIAVPEEKPIIIPGNGEISVTYAFDQRKRYNDMVTYITTHPAKNFTVHAFLCDPAVQRLILEADAAHRLSPVSDPVIDANDRYFKWKIPKAMLPGQGIELRWYEKPPPKPMAAQTVPSTSRPDLPADSEKTK